MKVIFPEANFSYSQIGQTKNVKFACINIKEDTAFALHPPFLCRDFLSDVLFSEEAGKKVTIYGFAHDSKVQSWEKAGTNLLVQYCNKSKFLENLPVLHDVEEKMGLSFTQVIDCGENLIFLGDIAWRQSTLMLSLYTLIIRLLSYDSPKKTFDSSLKSVMGEYSNDRNYWTRIKEKIDLSFFFKEWRAIHEGGNVIGHKDYNVDVDTIHDNGGIVNWGNNTYSKPGKGSLVFWENYQRLLAESKCAA